MLRENVSHSDDDAGGDALCSPGTVPGRADGREAPAGRLPDMIRLRLRGVVAALVVCTAAVAPTRPAGAFPAERAGARVGVPAAGAAARPAAGPQTPPDAPPPEACVLPDLSRMHPAVQAQLGDAWRALAAPESAGGGGAPPPTADRVQSAAAAASTRAGGPAVSPTADPRRGEARGALGMLLLAADYPDAAGRCLRRAARLAPGEFRWPYYLGHAFMRLGDLDGAVDSFERALRIDPEDVAALVWLMHAQVDRDRPDEAERLLARARALHPNTQAVLYQGGRAALAAGNHAEAVKRLEAALRLNPAATVIHYPLAMAWRGAGDLDRARDHLARGGARTGGRTAAGGAVAFPDPLMAAVYTMLRSPQSHRDLGLQAAERGDWPEAVRQLGRGVEMAPDNAVMRLNLGTALIRVGEAPAALVQLEAAVRLDPGFAAAHFLIGTLFERSGRDAEAVERYTAAATSDASLSVAHLRLGDALRRTGRFEAALLRYRKIQGEQARFGEAMALVRLGRYVEALQTLGAAGERYPAEPSFPHAMARLLAAAPDAAVRDGRRALELAEGLAAAGHRTAGVAETTAMAMAELGRFGEAVEWQSRAMEVAASAARPDVARAMTANLARYQGGEPCRTPWRDAEPEHNPGPAVDPHLLTPGPGG